MISNVFISTLIIPTNMILNIFIGLCVIAVTVVLQAVGTSFWLKYLAQNYFSLSFDDLVKRSKPLLIKTASFLLLLNFGQSIIWAITYYIIPGITEFSTLEESIYFSLVTFTTLGYGDITISSSYRILAGLEAINGVLLLGWSTTMMFSVMQIIWKKGVKHHQN